MCRSRTRTFDGKIIDFLSFFLCDYLCEQGTDHCEANLNWSYIHYYVSRTFWIHFSSVVVPTYTLIHKT